MKGKIIALVLLLLLLGMTGITGAWADENTDESVNENTDENTITFEQAVDLAVQNSRDMTKYKIGADKAKYQLYQAQESYRDANNEAINASSEYNALSDDYSDLQEKYENETDEVERAKILDDMAEIEKNMDQQYEQLEKQSDLEDSALDDKESAEDNYDDALEEVANYEKQLSYIVAQQYTTILNQEANLQAKQKEYELKQTLLAVENKKLQLGRTSRTAVDNLALEARQLAGEIDELEQTIKAQKGSLNDMLGREYEQELTLVHFEVPEAVELPEFDGLKSAAVRENNALAAIQRNISKKRDDRKSVNESDYQYDVLQMEIKELELQLEAEKVSLNEKLNSLMADLQAKQESYQVSLVNYDKALQDYEWNKKRYELGLVSGLDLRQSELDCQRAKDKSVAAGYDLYLAGQSLELAGEGIL